MIPFPNKKYNIIYADPAWKFKTYSEKGKKRSPEKHYPCLDIEEIKKLPIQNLTDKNCYLFMWVTYPTLLEGLSVIKEWGFTYKTCAFSWVKRNKKAESFFMGMGYYTRTNNEICILATKGKLKRQSKKVRQIVYEPIREHSRKPDCVRDRIVQLCGDLPRIELFARQKTDGWDYWGNEL